jgi:hypothetical protein
MLVEDTLRSMEAHLTHKQGTTTSEQRTNTFHQKVLRGNLWGAVRFSQSGKKEESFTRMISMKDQATPSSLSWSPSIPMLGFQESMLSPTTPSSPTSWTSTSPRIPSKLQPAAYPEALGWEGRMPTRYSNGCCALGNQVGFYDKPPTANLVDCLANSFPPWAAYRALMAGRLVALDKCPGVRPIRVGETWWRLAAKATLLVSGCDAKEQCGIDQLCAGLEAGIKGGIHAINELWRQHKEEEEWGFLLVDAANAFNELNRTAMLWTIRHEWPSGARFAFNSYRHWATLVIRGKGGTVVLTFSK